MRISDWSSDVCSSDLLLNNVVDYILHLEGGRVTLYPGGYDAFERQRAERLAHMAAARAKQQAERAKLQDYVARNSARASPPKQAQTSPRGQDMTKPLPLPPPQPTPPYRIPHTPTPT